MKKLSIIIFLSLVIFASCKAPKNGSIDKDLVGTWKELHLINDIDTTTVLTAIEPEQYIFKDSGVFEYRIFSSEKDTIYLEGFWHIDTLANELSTVCNGHTMKRKYKLINDSILHIEEKEMFGPDVWCYIVYRRIK